jgi:hypothetical protein
MKPTPNSHISVLAMNDKGPAPEAAIGRDLVKHGLIVAPVLLGLGAIFWGADGAWSSAYGLTIVLGNFALAAFLVSFSARISYAMLMGATLFGYIVRLGIISAAVYFVRNAEWVELIPLCMTIVIAHVGLLFWELRYVSLSLAFPGLKPKQNHNDPISSHNTN